jgi:hypothetical protein
MVVRVVVLVAAVAVTRMSGHGSMSVPAMWNAGVGGTASRRRLRLSEGWEVVVSL